MIEFGSFNGKTIYKATISNGKVSADIINYGATLTSLRVRYLGKEIDVVLGYDSLEGYISDDACFGRTVGRVCNRIKDAKFILNDKEYSLTKNDGENCLHSGKNGLSNKVWEFVKVNDESVTLRTTCFDGEDGFPANLTVETTYTITNDNCLETKHRAVADADTIVSITNHSYFNLNGQGTGSVLEHNLLINSTMITPVDNSICPFNTFMDVKGTAFDFTSYKALGKEIDSNDEILKICNGYDNNYCLSGDITKMASSIVGNKTGLEMQVYTDQKGMQIYTANFLTKRKGKGEIYDKRGGVCFETQNPPNAINCPAYPSPILKKGEEYFAKTIYKFCI